MLDALVEVGWVDATLELASGMALEGLRRMCLLVQGCCKGWVGGHGCCRSMRRLRYWKNMVIQRMVGVWWQEHRKSTMCPGSEDWR